MYYIWTEPRVMSLVTKNLTAWPCRRERNDCMTPAHSWRAVASLSQLGEGSSSSSPKHLKGIICSLKAF